MALEYKKTKSSWGLKALFFQTEFIFSGNFNSRKVVWEQITTALDDFIRVALWIFAAIGLLALVFSAWLAFPSKDWVFVLERHSLNQIFWVSCLTDLYLWAKVKQTARQEAGVNLLELSQTASEKKQIIDVYHLFNRQAKRVWHTVSRIAAERKSANITSVDVFLALLQDSDIKMFFYRLGTSVEDIQTILTNYFRLSPEPLDTALPLIPFAALEESFKLQNRTLDPLMILCGLLRELPEDHIIQSVCFNLNLDLETAETIAAWIFTTNILSKDWKVFQKLSKYKPDNSINKGLTSVPTLYLDRFSTDITRLAKHGYLPLATGRQNDLQEIFKLFEGDVKNIVIKGAEGSGRTTLVHELGYKMATEEVPRFAQDKRLVKLETTAIAGTRGKAENVLSETLQEAVHAGNIVLVIEDIHQLAKIHTPEGLTLLDILIGFLGEHNLSVIATTTIEDYTDSLASASNFAATFTSYELPPLSARSVLLACCVRASILEIQNDCFFTYRAIAQAVTLSDLYVKSVSQPQKAISVLVEAATKMKSNGSKYKVVTEEAIAKIVSARTHIPAGTLSQDETEKLLNLENFIGKAVIGQREAVTAVAEGLRRARSGLSSKNRPLASFLFLGPTGVGKTELAKTLASVYFGEEKFLLRLDMSEYRGDDGLQKLLGSGASDTALIKHLKNYPFSLLLVDEFEKASPEIHNLFLQILEDGRLTTARGETLDLTSTMIIATSNAGTKEIQTGIREGKTLDQIRTNLFNTTLTATYPPELLNRFDGVIIFSPLTQTEVEKVTFLQLEHLREQLRNKGIKIQFSDKVIQDIGKNAYDPALGARPIHRYIQDHVEGFIAKLILGKKLSRGSEATIDLQNGQLTIVQN